MAQSLDIYIDTTNGNLVAAGSARNGTLPTLTRNDSYNLRVRLQERDSSGLLRDLDTTGSSVKLGIGGIDDAPTSGAFKLTINGVTSNAITYSTDEATVAGYIYTAVSNNVATVTTYGNEPDAYILTATQPNTAMSFGGSAFTLFPTSSVLVGTRRFPASSIAAQQVIRLVRNPAVYSDTFVASATAGVVSLTKIQDGSSTKNETYDLAIGSDAEGGSVVLNYGTNSTTAIPIGATAASFQEALTSITAISTGNISVDIGNNAGNYSISFVRGLGLTNITTALTLDASGVIFGNFLQTTVTMATEEIDELFAESGEDTIAPIIEVELTQGGTPKTVLQADVTVRRDLITTGSAVPAAQASYYTKSETNGLFVQNSITGVDSANRYLNDSNGTYSIDWENRIVYDTGFNPILNYSNGAKFDANIGFYGTTPTAKPANTNVVSALVSLGLIANTVTIGVAGGGSVTFPTVALTGSAITVTDNIPFVFGTTNGSKFGTATAQKISFYNSTPIVQPASTTVVSALVDLGLIASTVTLGLPTNVVTDWAGNVSATTRFLADSSAVTSVDWGNRVLKTSTGATSLNWETGAFGSGSTVVTIATNNVAISGSYYIAMGTGNGAFRTLSTTASIAFGSVAGNSSNSVSVVVTGCAINDIVLLGLPTAISAGLSFIGHVTTANGLEVDAVNATNSTINQSTQTFRITVLNYQ